MNQPQQQLPLQPQQDMLYNFAPQQNRSPNSSRDLYSSATGFPAGLPMPRTNQRPLENLGPLLPTLQYGAEEQSYNSSTSRFDRMPPPGVNQGYMAQNEQAWEYNAATVNGGMNGTGRLRNVNRRAPIPNAWIDPGAQQSFQSVGAMNNAMPLGILDNHGGMQGATSNPIGSRGPPSHQKSDKPDEIIRTAIVIKNIPFALKKEILQAIMGEMNLPMPYAFNYHFEGDAFRGLAFANFLSEDDTATVIGRLNQLEVMGRKLRVEYKKQLPDHERERIEREKKEKRGQLRMQHEPMTLHQQTSLQSITAALANNLAPNLQPRPSPLRDVDFNDPETLNFYTELTLFRNDPSREILVFPSTITPEQRRQLHILAHNMGLEHQSVGEADQRQLQIMKRRSPTQAQPPIPLAPAVSYDAHRRGLSRAATIDFAESRTGSMGHYNTIGRQGPTLEVPGSPDGAIPSNLRAAKSFADLRSYTPSPSSVSSFANAPQNGLSANINTARYGEYTSKLNPAGPLATPPNLTPTTPGTGVTNTPAANTESLLSSLGTLSLGYDPTQGMPLGAARSNPGAIGSQRPSATQSANRVAAERQPRGPSIEWETGFGSRARTNGHMQRSSDSSDNTGRPPNSSGGTRFLS